MDAFVIIPTLVNIFNYKGMGKLHLNVQREYYHAHALAALWPM